VIFFYTAEKKANGRLEKKILSHKRM